MKYHKTYNDRVEDSRMAYIYVVVNKVDGICYVGQSMKPEERIYDHLHGNSNVDLINEHVKEYGKENFTHLILDKCRYDHRSIVEEYWTRKYKAKFPLYNKIYGYYNPDQHGYKFKKTMSKATKGENNPMYGKKDEEAVNGNKIFMYDKDWNLQKEFPSVKMACKYLKLKGHSGLYIAIRDKTIFKGHYWDCKRRLYKV